MRNCVCCMPESRRLRRPKIKTEIHRQYSAIREGVAAGTPITILLIDTEQTVVSTGSGAEPEAVLALAIGSHKTAADFFKHNPPTQQELENAIVTVEDSRWPGSAGMDTHARCHLVVYQAGCTWNQMAD